MSIIMSSYIRKASRNHGAKSEHAIQSRDKPARYNDSFVATGFTPGVLERYVAR